MIPRRSRSLRRRCPPRVAILAALVVAAAPSGASSAAQPPPTPEADGGRYSSAITTAPQATEAGVRAVIYGLPIVLMEITLKKTTNAVPGRHLIRPVNQFAHMRAFPTAAFKDVVRANVDTLYSSAFLDLAQEPLVLSVPDTHGRYYLLPMLDAWTNVFATPGSRTTGTAALAFLITGPRWVGDVPAGMQQLKSPTDMAWILGRTETHGPDDYAAVHAIQDGYTLVPLSRYGKPYDPPAATFDPGVDMQTPPIEQVRRMSAATFFSTLARLLEANPPPADEAPVLAMLAGIGIRPGRPFDPRSLDPAVAAALEHSVDAAFSRLQEAQRNLGSPANGWHIPPRNVGAFATDFRTRAIIAMLAFGANLPADAIYPTTFVDSAGQPLDGAHRYVLHFEPGRAPPVNAFWSVTMYDADSFFVDNPINRYAVSSWMPLRKSADGSLDIYLQTEPPAGDQTANWLPAPAGRFNVTLRMYWPTDSSPSINDGTWQPPPIVRRP